VGFNLFTLFVFITAPVDWQTDRFVEVCLFVLLCQLLIVLGFGLGRRTELARSPSSRPPAFSGDRFVSGLFVIYVLTFPVSYGYWLGASPFDFGGMVSTIVAGLRDPQLGYSSALGRTGSGPMPWTVYFVVSIFNQIFFAAGFLYWRQLKRAAKTIFLILLGIDLTYWVGIATSFGVVSLVTTFGISTMFWSARRESRRFPIAARLVLPMLLLSGTIAFFSHNLYRRSNFTAVDVSRYRVADSPMIFNHPAFAVIPKPLWPTYVMVVSYFGQGYYHTSFAFDLDFRPTGFLSSNPALVSMAQSLIGIDVWSDTYMHRLQRHGIDEFGVWHSAYTWFASDVSFYGVPPLLFVFGFLFGFSWTQGKKGDFLSRVVFVLFGNVLLFLWANNTYLSSVFYSFMVFVPFWMFTRFIPVALGGSPFLRRVSALVTVRRLDDAASVIEAPQ
jgi:hypothetical protein